MPPFAPLGFIRKRDRSAAQHAFTSRVEAGMVKHSGLPVPTLAKGEKVILFDAWKSDPVVKELGFAFPRFHQLTGSCVGAGGGNALMLNIAVQALNPDKPTRPILPWWPYAYGMCRADEGDRGQGEGAMGSSFAARVLKGVLDANETGLPKFTNNDGLVLTSQLEMQWSDGGSNLVNQWEQTAAHFPLQAATPIKTSQDAKALVLNGYGGPWACDNYIGNASVQGSGADAAVVGFWNGSGGHQQYFGGYWENPTLGPLYAVGNNWPGSTYPADPGGLPICMCWVTEAKVDEALQRLDAEVYGFSHQKWFDAQPWVLNTFI